MSVAPAPILLPESETAHSVNALPAFEARCVLHGVPWTTYDDLTRSNENNHLRLTYDQGDLEVMSPSGRHARISHVIGAAIYEWIMLNRITAEFGGNMTLKRREFTRGLEADECYWITSAAAMRGKDEIELAIDPPPDLALKVEVSHPLLPKLPIYQALGVPEVWHWHDDDLSVLRLAPSQGYRLVSDSVELPGFPFGLTKAFIRERNTVSTTEMMMRIRTEFTHLLRK
jgi:Uma2 family endonuclease